MPKVPNDNKATLPARTVVAGDIGKSQDDSAEAPETCKGFAHLQTGSNIDRSEEVGHDGNGQIHERNGIWVVTIDGIWRGDYIKREHAIAATNTAGRDRR